MKRFWDKVNVGAPNECWEWTARRAHGYGYICIAGKEKRAHRVAYELTHGAVPEGLNVLHSCDNRGCVNPAHLRAGTQSENLKEAFAKGRHKFPPVQGRCNPSVRLSENTVQRLRLLGRALPDHRAAEILGVSKATVQAIMSGRNWGHLNPVSGNRWGL